MSLRLSTAPHIRSPRSTNRLMLNVVIALLPCAAAGVYYFGMDALMVLSVAMVSSVAAEYAWQKLAGKPVRINDFSALVTGLILGLSLPPAMPIWLVAVGSAFAIIIVKQLFGGIGDNFLNPAAAARAVLLASWPARMATAVAPTCWSGVDAVTTATPLVTKAASYQDLLFGNVPGAIGETCKIAVLIGFVLLIVTRTISWRIPVIMTASTFLFAFLLGNDPVYEILSGGVLFAAVFMATDYTTSPMTVHGQVVFAAGIGLITVIIRNFGNYPEGITYALLFMNILVPLLDRYMPHKIYGYKKEVPDK